MGWWPVAQKAEVAVLERTSVRTLLTKKTATYTSKSAYYVPVCWSLARSHWVVILKYVIRVVAWLVSVEARVLSPES